MAFIFGSPEIDIIVGTSGDDDINVAAGADIAYGNDGNDRIVGDSDDGSDTLLFTNAQVALTTTFTKAQGWNSQDSLPRLVGDVNGDGQADIVGFGGTNVLVALGQPDGSFAAPQIGYAGWFTLNTTWNGQNAHPRTLADVNGDGRTDIVGFAGSGAYVALGQADGTFAAAQVAYPGWFGKQTNWNSQDAVPRQVADVNGDGRADVVGFASNAIYVALGQTNGTFSTAQLAYSGAFTQAQGWNSQDALPRLLGDVNGDGRADIVGFGSTNVLVALGQPDGSFAAPQIGYTGWFTLNTTWNGQNVHPRTLGDVDGDGRADIIGFAGIGPYVALGQADGTFTPTQAGYTGWFGNQTSWATQDAVPRQVSDVDGDGRGDVIGFASNAVYVARSVMNSDELYGGAGNDSLYGGAGSDLLFGGEGADELWGGAWADTLAGGIGNDLYRIDAADTVVEMADEGTDEVRTAVAAYTLAANLEILTYIGSATFAGTGNAGGNRLTGGTGGDTLSGLGGNDTLDGGTGADSLVGGIGNDLYIVDETGDVVVELAYQGTDTVQSAIDYTLGENVERLVLTGFALNGTGNALNNSLTGTTGANLLIGLAGNDTLNGGAGADTLIGGTGNDSYTIDSAADVIVELAGEGTDTVNTSFTYALLADFENLTLTGGAAIDGTGTVLNNALTGNGAANRLYGLEGDDTLNGGGGGDTLVGGAGNDSYLVDNAGDQVVELEGEGNDTVSASVSYTLGGTVEHLTLTGTAAITGTGNDFDNRITGNGGANVLDGGLGADTLAGGAGNDIYLIDAADLVLENVGQGFDEVRTSLSSYALGADLEAVTYTGSGSFLGTGNTLDNQLTGGTGADTLTGYDGADTLDGGVGADSLIGGLGDDLYVVDEAGDVIVEQVEEGLDEVRTSLSAYALGADLEVLTYSGADAFTGTGNALDNRLTGGAGADTLVGAAGADTLDGGSGADSLAGGAGDDLYLVDDTADQVLEGAEEGTDEVRTGLSSFLLTENIERLVFTGSMSFTGTGNGLDNWIAGGGGGDTLTGAAGADTLIGGSGDDQFSGGDGADLFVVTGGGEDRIIDFDATQDDRIGLSASQTYTVEAAENGDAVIVFGASDRLHLANVQPAAVSASWFVGT